MGYSRTLLRKQKDYPKDNGSRRGARNRRVTVLKEFRDPFTGGRYELSLHATKGLRLVRLWGAA